jgi:transketolase
MRQETPVIYDNDETFHVGGSKVIRQTDSDRLTLVAAGTTVHEALKAHGELQRAGIAVRVIDAYSIKPLDVRTLQAAAADTRGLVTIEDHYPAGGLGEAVLDALADRPVPVTILAVRRTPMSGGADQLRDFAGISADAIVRTVERLIADEPTDAVTARRT